MASSEGTTRYTPLRPSSPLSSPFHDSSLPSTSVVRLPKSYSISANPTTLLRIVSSILSLIAFIILVIDGGSQFIAADIFLMLILLLNIFLILYYSISDVFKVTVELRQQPWSRDLAGQKTPKIATFFDCGLSGVCLLCLIIGSAAKRRWEDGAWQGAVIVGYFVILLQFATALPFWENMVLQIKLYETRGKVPLDTKRPEVVDETERGSARRRTPESEDQGQSAEDLV